MNDGTFWPYGEKITNDTVRSIDSIRLNSGSAVELNFPNSNVPYSEANTSFIFFIRLLDCQIHRNIHKELRNVLLIKYWLHREVEPLFLIEWNIKIVKIKNWKCWGSSDFNLKNWSNKQGCGGRRPTF